VATYKTGDRLSFYEAVFMPTGKPKPDGKTEFHKALTTDQAAQLALNGLLSACYQFWPDVVVFVTGFLVPTEMVELIYSRGHKVVIICTESPYETSRELGLAEHADLVLLNDPTHIERFREVAPTIYAHQAYRPTVHTPGPSRPDLVSDLAFVGTGYPSRIEFLEAMDLSNLDVILAGNWQGVTAESSLFPHLANAPDECLPNGDAVQLYRSARMGINLYRREAQRPELSEGWSCGPREIEMAAVGLPFLREPRGESDELFPMLPSFTSPEEASELLRWWLAHPAKREEAALKARSAIADRTFHNLAVELLRHLES
jgi:spore maturation protein CgeB